MSTDLLLQLQRPRWESGEVFRQSWAAEKALRCLEEETWCSREMIGHTKLGAGWGAKRAVRGTCGGSPAADKEAKTQGRWFTCHCHWKIVRELSDPQLTPWTIPAITGNTSNTVTERRDTGPFIMTTGSLFCLVWWHCIHKKQVEKASSNSEDKAPLRQKPTDPFFPHSLADVTWSFQKEMWQSCMKCYTVISINVIRCDDYSITEITVNSNKTLEY